MYWGGKKNWTRKIFQPLIREKSFKKLELRTLQMSNDRAKKTNPSRWILFVDIQENPMLMLGMLMYFQLVGHTTVVSHRALFSVMYFSIFSLASSLPQPSTCWCFADDIHPSVSSRSEIVQTVEKVAQPVQRVCSVSGNCWSMRSRNLPSRHVGNLKNSLVMIVQIRDQNCVSTASSQFPTVKFLFRPLLTSLCGITWKLFPIRLPILQSMSQRNYQQSKIVSCKCKKSTNTRQYSTPKRYQC